MTRPEIDQICEDSKLDRFITRKAGQASRKAIFRHADADDLRQEMWFAVWHGLRRFDPRRGRPTHLAHRTAKNRLADLIRQAQRSKRGGHVVHRSLERGSSYHFDKEPTTLGAIVERDHRYATPLYDPDRAFLQSDVQAVLNKLSADDRHLCDQLQHRSVTQIARDTGVSRSTLHDRIANIRKVFRAHNLHEYLSTSRSNMT